MGLLNFIDTVLAGVPEFEITYSDNTTEIVKINLATAKTVNGTALNKVLFDKIDNYLCPVGIITMWSGSVGTIPTGWALCNGQNGTPDLRDRFIVGAGSSYNVGSTGGESSVQLQTANLPAHKHSFNTYSSPGGMLSHDYLRASGISSGGYVKKETGKVYLDTSSDMINDTGSGTAHENRPPYYALAYIMKISN